jgi:hypothetical protein
MSNLPIRRVVLYKHGVGYFERETQIEGDQSLSLSFKQREVSDVLKSLTVLDLGDLPDSSRRAGGVSPLFDRQRDGLRRAEQGTDAPCHTDEL